MGNLCAIYQQSIFNTPLGKFFRSPFFGVIETLSTTGLLTRDTFNTIANHQDLLVLTDVLDRLSSEGLLTGDAGQIHRDFVAKHQEPVAVSCALEHLRRNNVSLTGNAGEANFNAIAKHQRPFDVASALTTLSSEGVLTDDAAAQATFNAIIAGHQAPSGVANALNPLHSVGEPVGLDDAFGRTAEQGTSVPVVAHTTTIIPQSFFGAVRPPVNTTPEVDEMQFTGLRS